jgi:hypothetical protein
MHTRTYVTTKHALVLDPEEQFRAVDGSGREISVMRVTAEQFAGGDWNIDISGPRMLKSGKRGAPLRFDRFHISRSFGPEARMAVWDLLSDQVKQHLISLGVKVDA